ncbi:hypothetical protein [Paraburkholderia elongata]|nr:hypothetical protein [Paraburkholderia elongata]
MNISKNDCSSGAALTVHLNIQEQWLLILHGGIRSIGQAIQGGLGGD